MDFLSRKLIICLLVVFIVGCGGGGGGGSSASQSGSTATVSGSPNTGTIVLQQTLLRAVPSSVNLIRCTGFDSLGATRYGPQTFNKAPRIELVDVSTAVTRLQIEYLQDDTVVGMGVIPVVVSVGETVVVAEPAFEDVNVVVDSIVVTPVQSTLAKGTTRQLTATGNFSDGTQQDLTGSVTWSSSAGNIATVSSTGVVTGVTPGTSTITARLGSRSGAAEITVSPATVVSLVLTPPSPSIANGTTQQFAATAVLTDNTTQDVTALVEWTSSQAGVAAIDGNGRATSLSTGQTTVTARLGSVSSQATLTVTQAVVTSIQVSPAGSTIADGLSRQFEAIATFSDLSTQDVTAVATWSSSQTNAAIIAPGGLATALDPGTTVVSATFGGVTGQADLTVTSATISSISVTPQIRSIANGTTQQFTAVATLTDNSTQDVTSQADWSSSTSAVASVDGNGLATSVGQGQTAITASVGSVSGQANLTVTAAVAATITVEPTTSSIVNGTTLQYRATATFTDSSTQDVTDRASWLSSQLATATVAPDGLATATEAGVTTISASFGGQIGSASLTVTPRATRLEVFGNVTFERLLIKDGSGVEATFYSSRIPKLIFENGDILELNPEELVAVSRDTSVVQLYPVGNFPAPDPVGAGQTFIDYSVTYQGTTFTESLPVSVTVFRARTPFVQILAGNSVTCLFDILRPNGDVVADVANIQNADVEITLLERSPHNLSGITLVSGAALGTVQASGSVENGKGFFLKIRYFDPVLDRNLEAVTSVTVLNL